MGLTYKENVPDTRELPEVKYNLDVGSDSHAEETGEMLIGIDKR